MFLSFPDLFVLLPESKYGLKLFKGWSSYHLLLHFLKKIAREMVNIFKGTAHHDSCHNTIQDVGGFVSLWIDPGARALSTEWLQAGRMNNIWIHQMICWLLMSNKLFISCLMLTEITCSTIFRNDRSFISWSNDLAFYRKTMKPYFFFPVSINGNLTSNSFLPQPPSL